MYYYKEDITTSILNEWISKNFSHEDALRYYNALDKNNDLWQSYIDRGWLKEEIVYKRIFVPQFNEFFDFRIGHKLLIQPGVSPSQLQISPEYNSFLNRIPPELHPISSVLMSED